MQKTIISADSHITEPPNCYIDYIDPKFRDIAPKIVRDEAKVAGAEKCWGRLPRQVRGHQRHAALAFCRMATSAGAGPERSPSVDNSPELDNGCSRFAAAVVA